MVNLIEITEILEIPVSEIKNRMTGSTVDGRTGLRFIHMKN